MKVAERLQPVDEHADERVHDRGDEQLAAAMRLVELLGRDVPARRRQVDRSSQRLPAHERELLAHLLRKAEEQRLAQRLRGELRPADSTAVRARACRLAAVAIEQPPRDAAQRKHGEQRDDVREPFVKRRLVGRRRIRESLAQPVDERVRGFVRHDVVRQTGEHRALAAREIPEEQRLIAFGVERVGVGERVRRDVELMAAKSPADAAPERKFESRQRPHHDRIHVLRVKAGISEDGSPRRLPESILREAVAVRRVLERLVQRARRAVVVDDVHAIPPGTRARAPRPARQPRRSGSLRPRP